ncbi:hypothetical protein OIU79_021011 [Salix purpurea]|uniref:Uncharacterized protein n=1 Tax=Salix purpurea TaxID=77065 RepID=A0A9Q0WR97_SALPP|nr:hypothetical protein OIU79_021011 [Salix purpurea]
MAKRKAKKKSPSSSSRPPLLHVQLIKLLWAPTNAPPQIWVAASSLSFPRTGCFGAVPSLVASGPIGVDQAPPIAPLQPPSPKLQTSKSSPSFSMLFAPVGMDSPGDSENDDSSTYNSDSSSHYGSPALANLELNARHPSPASSAPADAEGPLEVPAASPSVGVNKSPASAASVLPTSSSAKKVVLSSKGTESVHNSVALAPLTDEGLQDPMVCEAATGVYDWQPVSKKHTSNRQPKIGSVSAALALGKDSSTSKGKSVEVVGNVSGGIDLTALGSDAAGSAMGMGCVGLNGKPVGAVPQASGCSL